MEPIKLSEICRVLGVEMSIPDCNITKIAHIKRNIEKDCLFFAFKTWRIDTYSNIEIAIEKGAKAIVTDRLIESYPCIVVENPLAAFMKIATYIRHKYDFAAIAVTGSVGKTSTKEMIYCAISHKLKTVCSKENSNSSDLVAMDIFDFSLDVDAFIHEIAIQDIHFSSMVFQPTIAVITNIGLSHVESFGSTDNICREKLKIFDGLLNGGLKVLNADDEKLVALSYDRETENVMYYGICNMQADIKAIQINYCNGGYDFVIDYYGEKYNARVNCEGKHNILNALAAFGIGRYLNIDAEALIAGIAEFSTKGYRQNKMIVDDTIILADCFNAAPLSVKNAIDTLSDMYVSEDAEKIVVLGDMLELGTYSLESHREVCRYLNGKNIKKVVLYGDEYIKAAESISDKDIDVECFYRRKELIKYLEDNARKRGNVVLFKGSHGMELECVIDEVYHTNLHDDYYKNSYFIGRVIRERVSLKDFLLKKGIHSVAFYGVLPETIEIIDFFREEGIAVEYAIDRKAPYIPKDIYPIDIYTMGTTPKKVDCIIVTTHSVSDSFEKYLKENLNMPILTLKRLSEELFE